MGMRRAGRNYQKVVGKLAVVQHHLASGSVDRFRLTENHFDVRLMAQDSPDRAGDIAWIERRGSDLVEQGLEEMMIAAIDKGYSYRGAAKRPRRGQTTETSAHDQNVWKAP